MRFYLSSDDALDAGDVLLGTRMIASLGAGASSSTVSSFTVPGNTSVPRTYRVIAVADALNQQPELGRDEQPGGVASGGEDRLPARPRHHCAERAGHGSGGREARHRPHRPQRRARAGRCLRDPVLPFVRRRTGCGRRAVRHPECGRSRCWRQQPGGQHVHDSVDAAAGRLPRDGCRRRARSRPSWARPTTWRSRGS